MSRNVFVVVVIGVLAFGAYKLQQTRSETLARVEAARAPKAPARDPAAARPQTVDVGVTMPASTTPAAEPRDDDAIRRQIDEGAKDSYIKDMLAADSRLVRWAPRRLEALACSSRSGVSPSRAPR